MENLDPDRSEEVMAFNTKKIAPDLGIYATNVIAKDLSRPADGWTVNSGVKLFNCGGIKLTTLLKSFPPDSHYYRSTR